MILRVRRRGTALWKEVGRVDVRMDDSPAEAFGAMAEQLNSHPLRNGDHDLEVEVRNGPDLVISTTLEPDDEFAPGTGRMRRAARRDPGLTVQETVEALDTLRGTATKAADSFKGTAKAMSDPGEQIADHAADALGYATGGMVGGFDFSATPPKHYNCRCMSRGRRGEAGQS